MEKTQTVIDLSKWNIINDYKAMLDGIAGVILRIGYRSKEKGIITEDPRFKTHLEGVRGANKPVGIYFFTTAITEAEARQEADWVVSQIKRYNIHLQFPVAVDTEYSDNNKTGRSDKLNKAARTAYVLAFCKQIDRHGYRSMIYASDDWFVSQLEYSQVKPYLKWVARYSDNKPEKVKDNIVGWQKSDNFFTKGTNSRLDVSDWYAPINRKFSMVTPETDPKEDIRTGDMVILKDENLYKMSNTDAVAKKISGTYYYWDDQIKSGKVRITSKKEYVGEMGKVTGWIAVE